MSQSWLDLNHCKHISKQFQKTNTPEASKPFQRLPKYSTGKTEEKKQNSLQNSKTFKNWKKQSSTVLCYSITLTSVPEKENAAKVVLGRHIPDFNRTITMHRGNHLSDTVCLGSSSCSESAWHVWLTYCEYSVHFWNPNTCVNIMWVQQG